MTANSGSPGSGRSYGVERVCRAWDYPRSTFYQKRAQNSKTESGRECKPQKRGPKTRLSDEQLLALIRADLASSPFTGEGHRKVWARLKFGAGIKVGRNRVLRIMRANNLLSPRRPRRNADQHQVNSKKATALQPWSRLRER